MSHPRGPWEKHDQLVGRTIIEITSMSQQEFNYWGIEAIVLQLDDGTRWWLSADSEGNYSGDIHPVNHPSSGTIGTPDYDEGFTSQLTQIENPSIDDTTPSIDDTTGPLAKLICERLDEESARFLAHQMAGRSVEDFDGPNREQIIAHTIHEVLTAALAEQKSGKQFVGRHWVASHPDDQNQTDLRTQFEIIVGMESQ